MSARVLVRSEAGQTTTEYAILLGFLALAIIVAVLFLRGALIDLFMLVVNTLNPQPGA